MKSCLAFLSVVLFGAGSHASLKVQARYDYAQSDRELLNRLFLKSQVNLDFNNYSFYAEGFGNLNQVEETQTALRSPDRGYLQEAFFEYKGDSLYLKVGRFANRWSEMWTLPSLDIWTGRRWNRILSDDFSDQLIHSSGANVTWLWQTGSIDITGVAELAESEYPQPLPASLELTDRSKTGFGFRLRQEISPLTLTMIGARVGDKDLVGMGFNFATESVVTKFEWHYYAYDDIERTPFYELQNNYSYSLGFDIFWESLVLTPQITSFDFGPNSQSDNGFQDIYYMGIQWTPGSHRFFAQTFFNQASSDRFYFFEYTYNLNSFLSAGMYVQNYYAENPGLWRAYQDFTQDTVIGFKLIIEKSANL